MKTRPNVLTIAGFDPTNGAGLTADVKTFENLKCYGFAVQTANTVQTDNEFHRCHWQPMEVIKSQVSALFGRFEIDFVKIGIVENWKVLNEVVDHVLSFNKNAVIVLDPVLHASSNFEFHDGNNDELDQLLAKITLITPNYNEIKALYPEKEVEDTIAHMQKSTSVLLKGGHREEAIGQDELYISGGDKYVFNPKMRNVSEKHGSGCVLSSAVTSYLALNYPLIKACYRGKMYTEKLLSSNKSLLGYHK
ncbi:MAG: hydroxymethylpyrimidine/phosphomethylpyrimidine kinase [Crocinitomicaceae bacterium]|nr:hydroxymethylpyrimidine/phosphomethylpyrimidine kinase [Crocinitomicaceae bacterium]